MELNRSGDDEHTTVSIVEPYEVGLPLLAPMLEFALGADRIARPGQ